MQVSPEDEQDLGFAHLQEPIGTFPSTEEEASAVLPSSNTEPLEDLPPEPPVGRANILREVEFEREGGRDDESIAVVLATIYTSHLEDGGYPEDWLPPPGFQNWTGYAVRVEMGEADPP